jgi:hypothetical protein
MPGPPHLLLPPPPQTLVGFNAGLTARNFAKLKDSRAASLAAAALQALYPAAYVPYSNW